MGTVWLQPSHSKIDLTPVKVEDIVAQNPILNGKPNFEKTKVPKTTNIKDNTQDNAGLLILTSVKYI